MSTIAKTMLDSVGAAERVREQLLTRYRRGIHRDIAGKANPSGRPRRSKYPCECSANGNTLDYDAARHPSVALGVAIPVPAIKKKMSHSFYQLFAVHCYRWNCLVNVDLLSSPHLAGSLAIALRCYLFSKN